MATDDIQRLVTGTAPAPATFTVPGNGQIQPKTIFAHYDGSGAAGDFLPALKITSDAGGLVGIYPTSSSVAAGASADVSWFPRVAAASGGATTTNAQWFEVVRSSNLTMLAGTEDTIPWSSLKTSDSSLFSLATDNHPNDAVAVARQGVLVVSSALVPTGLGTDFIVGILNNLVGQGVAGEENWNPMEVWNRDGLPSNVEQFGPRAVSLMVMSQVPQQVTARYHNFDGANRVTVQCVMAGLWWPTGALIS